MITEPLEVTRSYRHPAEGHPGQAAQDYTQQANTAEEAYTDVFACLWGKILPCFPLSKLNLSNFRFYISLSACTRI